MNKYALLGKNVEKSLSPRIHSLISEFFDIAYEYEAISIKEEQEFCVLLNDDTYSGYNITSPYKLIATKYADSLSKDVKVCRSTNTIKKNDGEICAYTTDGSGYVKSLEFGELNIKNKKILVYGSGGAARSIIMSLLEGGASSVMIAARNSSERIAVYNLFKEIYDSKVFIVENFFGLVCDLAINTTPVGTYDVEGLSLNPDTLTVKYISDIITTPVETELVKRARSSNLITFTGLDMLILQAYYSFVIWNDITPIDREAFELLSFVKSRL